MNRWSAVWTNNPYDDFNLVLEILYFHDDNHVAVIKQSQEGLILKWYINPNGSTIPVDWLSGLLLSAKEGIVDPTTINEEIQISQWTAEWTNVLSDDNNPISKILCDDTEVAIIRQSQQGLILNWHTCPSGLIIPVDWLSDLLLEAITRAEKPM